MNRLPFFFVEQEEEEDSDDMKKDIVNFPLCWVVRLLMIGSCCRARFSARRDYIRDSVDNGKGPSPLSTVSLTSFQTTR